MFILILLQRFGFKKLVFHRSIGFQKMYLLLVAQLAPLIFVVQFTIKPKFDQEFGHFVRVLVNIDLRKLPIFFVLGERIGFELFLDIDYGNI